MNEEQEQKPIKAENNSDNGVDITKPKRKKTSRACNHCHKAHMTCDSGRPCKRCVQRGLDETCEDAPRKRKKYLDDVPNSSLAAKVINGSSQINNLNGHELHHAQSLESTLTNQHQQYNNLYNYSPQPQMRQSNERMQQSPTNIQQNNTIINPQPIPFQNGPSSNQLPFPQSQQSLGQTNTNEPPKIPNHVTYQATMFQHSATAPDITQSNSSYYYLNSNNQVPTQQVQNTEYQIQNQKQFQLPQHDPQLQRPPLNPNSPSSYIQSQRKTKFMSTAADLEYATLSNILQDNLGGHHTTSNEGTPNSHNFSPNLSPHNHPSTSLSKITSRDTQDQPSIDYNLDIPPIDSFNSKEARHHSLYDNSKYPKCDESINQYFIGKTDSDSITTFPDIITALEVMKNNDYTVYEERNSKSNLSFSVGISHEDNRSSISKDDSLYKEPEEIYAKVNKPFSYTPGYHSLIAYLRKRFSKPMLVKMAESMASYRPSFIACTNSLKEHDLIFMEQCFQRTLLTYDNFIKISGTPTIVWRRTGEIAYVGDEFCILTGWNKEELVGNGKRKFIVELLDDKSVVEYFQVFSRIAFGDFLGATITECTLLTPKVDVKIRTGCMWTLKRDVFGIPMMIVGNFLPII